MMPDWATNSVFFSDLLPARHPALWQSLVRILGAAGVEYGLLAGTRDIWCRDFMPVQVAADHFVRFRYQPGYLRGRDDLVTPDEPRRAVPPGSTLHTCEINLDGGNVVASSGRVIMTERVYRENPGYGRSALRQELAAVLGADCIFIPTEPGDVIGHADGVVRFIGKDMMLVNDYREIEPAYGNRLESVPRRHGINFERLPHLRTAEEIDGIPSAFGNYINYLRVGGIVIVPAYGVPQDDLVCRTLERLLPEATVMPLRCEELARDGGVLNCIAWTIRTARQGALSA